MVTLKNTKAEIFAAYEELQGKSAGGDIEELAVAFVKLDAVAVKLGQRVEAEAAYEALRAAVFNR